MARKVVRLSVIRNERMAARAKQVRSGMFDCCRDAAYGHGDSLVGFALVSWDLNGDIRTAVSTLYGPISARRAPDFCFSALQQHVTADLAQTTEAHEPEDKGA